MAAGSSQNVFRWYVAFGGFLCTRNSLLSDSLWSYSFFVSLCKLFCLKNVRHQTAVSRQLTACTTLIYYFDTYDTRFHSLAFPPLLLGDCHQALWVGTRSKTQKMAMKIARTRKWRFRRLHRPRFLSALLPQQDNWTMTSFYYNLKKSFSLLFSCAN